MNNKLVFDDSYTFHTKIYCDVFNFMKNVLNRARTGTCATIGTFTLVELKAWMHEPVVRSKTRRSIVQAVTSHIKFQSPKITN